MKVTMMLADYAQVCDGKLAIVGGGWTVTGPQPVPFGIALLVEVPWDRTNETHKLRLELLDADGQPVIVPTPQGDQPLFAEAELEVGRPPGMKPGTPSTVPMALNMPGQPIPPGSRYQWRLTINDETHEEWYISFSTRPEAASQAI